MHEIGNLYIIAAPSGTGKTTLVHGLLDTLAKIVVSISHTTRTKRPSEIQGVNYYFVDKNEFEHMIQQGDFLEYATIFDHLYGTSKTWVQKQLQQGLDVILEIDWQGFQQIKRIFPEAISIFILPPSVQDLHDRLINRNQDHPDIIRKRLADAKETVSHATEFDYIVVNDDFNHALHDLTVIVEAGRLRQGIQRVKLAALLKELADLH